jgi:hypothetical protein
LSTSINFISLSSLVSQKKEMSLYLPQELLEIFREAVKQYDENSVPKLTLCQQQYPVLRSLSQTTSFAEMKGFLNSFLLCLADRSGQEISPIIRDVCHLYMSTYCILHRPDVYVDETDIGHYGTRLLLLPTCQNFRTADSEFRQEQFYEQVCEEEGLPYVPPNDKPRVTLDQLAKKRLIAYKEISPEKRLSMFIEAPNMAQELVSKLER